MSKEEIIERLEQENAQLRAEVTALKNVVNGMNSFLSEVEEWNPHVEQNSLMI